MAAQDIVFEDGNNNGGEEGNKISHTETRNSTRPFTRAIRDVVSLCKLRRIVVAFLLALFPSRVENEIHFDLEIISTARNRNNQKKIHPCESRCLLLKFSHKIAQLVFTGECIFPEDTKLELVDAATGQQVRHGPLASAEVEIFLHNGDENWPIEELNSYIMTQKRGGQCKNPYLRLEGGVVSVNEIKFKHTSKHMKKLEMVKLGARVVDQSEEVIGKAVTGPFTLKDKHLKTKKRYPPSPTDDVWRLEKISRNGVFHGQLTEKGIRTVEDFLIELHINPQRLRHILGKNMSDNYWKKVTTHAKTCNIDGRKYLYYHLEMEQKVVVVFNVAGQVILLDSGCGLHHFNILSESQKAYARKLVETAFANWENVLKFDNDISIMDHLSSSKFSPSSCPAVDDFQHSDQLPLTPMSNFIQRTAESNEWMVSAPECSTSYAIVGQHAESDGMPLDIPAPGHTTTPNQITSVNSDSGDFWEKLMPLFNSEGLQFEDFPYGEPGQANYSVAETSATQFHGLQLGETMDLSQNQFTHLINSENDQSIIHEEGINANQRRQMNNISMVPVASMCKGKSKKGWTKISTILQWILLKRFVKLKKDRITKKRKFSR